MAGKVESVINQLNSWATRLRTTKYLDEIYRIVVEINEKLEYQPWYSSNPYIMDAASDLCHVFAVALIIKDLDRSKLVRVVYNKLVETFKGESTASTMAAFIGMSTESNEFKSLCLGIHAVLEMQGFPNKFDSHDIASTVKNTYDFFIEGNLRYSEKSKYFPLCVENYIKIFDLKWGHLKDHTFTYTVITSNLENPHKNAHSLLLTLLGKILAFEKTDTHRIVEDVLCNFSWLNSNKHHLLIKILEAKRTVLITHKEFDEKFFLEGVCVALKYPNLLSSSRLLLKSILKFNVWKVELVNIFLDILKNRSDLEFQNFLSHWFDLLDDSTLDLLYEKLKIYPDSSEFDQKKLLVFRSVFPKKFSEREDLDKFDSLINPDQEIEDDFLKLKVLDILFGKATEKIPDEDEWLENQKKFFKFLKSNVRNGDAKFHKVVLEKIPLVLDSASMRTNKNVEKILLFIKTEIYSTISESPLLFCLHLLRIQMSRAFDEKKFMDIYVRNLFDGKMFHELIGLIGCEISEFRKLSLNLLIKFFIKNKKQLLVDEIVLETTDYNSFQDMIADKIDKKLKETSVVAAQTAHLYHKLKLEHLKVIKSNTNHLKEGLQNLIDLLKQNFKEFKADPVLSVDQGKHLFNVINCINGILFSDESQCVENWKPFIVLLGLIVKTLLHQTNGESGNAETTAKVLEKNLSKLMENSKIDLKGRDPESCKNQVRSSIFLTCQACSSISGNLAVLVNKKIDPGENLYGILMESLIETNCQILKGPYDSEVLKSAGQALGKISKTVTIEGARTMIEPCEEDDFVGQTIHLLLKKIDESREVGRNLEQAKVFMHHEIIKNDRTQKRKFFDHAMKKLIKTVEVTSFESTKSIKFQKGTKSLHIKQLTALIEDSEMLEQLIPHLDFILVATFNAFKDYSNDPLMVSSLVQLVDAVIPKISNQKKQLVELGNLDYELKPVSFYEVYVKLTYSFRIALFDLHYQGSSLSASYIIALLEYFSHFEFRNFGEFYSEIERLGGMFKRLMGHKNEKIRYLSAKCWAQFQDLNKIKSEITTQVQECFKTSQEDRAYSSIICTIFMMKRFEAFSLFTKRYNRNSLFSEVREIVRTNHGNLLEKEFSYDFRKILLDLLIYLEFDFNDSMVKKLMFGWPTKIEAGFEVFKESLAKHLIN